MKIHHIGIVAKDVPETLAALGLSPDAVMESVFDPVQENTLHFVYLADNDLWLEIVQPMSDASSTASFARRVGCGLHHIGFASDGLNSSEALHSDRVGAFKLGQYQISVRSFGGDIRTLFIAMRGLIIEYVARGGRRDG
ncbi:MAG: hypothetical protein FJW30_30410 [Acidobacteria bacterium]|nr:hypothetical protein [Acidobacteriota bacterium]